MYRVCGIKDENAWNLFYDIIFLDPITTRHFSQFQIMWPHRQSRLSPYVEWWAAFRAYMGQMFDKTRDQMNNWRFDNPKAFNDNVKRLTNPPTTSSGKVKRTGTRLPWYGSDAHVKKIEPPSSRQYKPGQFVAARPTNWANIVDEEDDDANWADGAAGEGEAEVEGEEETAPGGGEEDGGEEDGGEDTTAGDKGKGKATDKGKGKATDADGNATPAGGKGKGTGKKQPDKGKKKTKLQDWIPQGEPLGIPGPSGTRRGGRRVIHESPEAEAPEAEAPEPEASEETPPVREATPPGGESADPVDDDAEMQRRLALELFGDDD